MTIPPRHHVESMGRLKENKGKRVMLEVVGPEGRVAMSAVLRDVKPFQAIWVSLGKEIRGFDFIGRGAAIRSIRKISDNDIERPKLYDNEANLPEELDYKKKTRPETYDLRKESFGERIADALQEPQLGSNPIILRGSYLSEHLRESEVPVV